MDRKVWLPSGGSLVIDRTEAMTVVDVNTGKFVGSGGNLEETVTKNNIEAAEEIVRQLRLRDIGGIIVIDFIDMVLESNRDLVVRRLLECLGRDRTKHQVAEVTSLGLVQMTRKRVGRASSRSSPRPASTATAAASSSTPTRSTGRPAASDSGTSAGGAAQARAARRGRRGRSGGREEAAGRRRAPRRPHARPDRRGSARRRAQAARPCRGAEAASAQDEPELQVVETEPEDAGSAAPADEPATAERTEPHRPPSRAVSPEPAEPAERTQRAEPSAPAAPAAAAVVGSAGSAPAQARQGGGPRRAAARSLAAEDSRAGRRRGPSPPPQTPPPACR